MNTSPTHKTTMKPLLFLSFLFLVSCQCPPPVNGIKAPCRYVGPAISGSVAFNGVSVGLTLWGDGTQPPTQLAIPSVILGQPINTK